MFGKSASNHTRSAITACITLVKMCKHNASFYCLNSEYCTLEISKLHDLIPWKIFRAMIDFRNEFLSALAMVRNSPSVGMFITSCYSHSQTEMPEAWFGANSPVLENTVCFLAIIL